jgi:hypothetical protein
MADKNNDRLKLLSQCAGSLNYAISALIMEIRELNQNTQSDPQPPRGSKNKPGGQQ